MYRQLQQGAAPFQSFKLWRNMSFLLMLLWSVSLVYFSNRSFQFPTGWDKSCCSRLSDLCDRISNSELELNQQMQHELKQLCAKSRILQQQQDNSITTQLNLPQLNAKQERLRRRVREGLTQLGFMLHGEMTRLKKMIIKNFLGVDFVRLKKAMTDYGLAVDLVRLKNKRMQKALKKDLEQLQNKMNNSTIEKELSLLKNKLLKNHLEKDLARLQNKMEENTLNRDLSRLKNKMADYDPEKRLNNEIKDNSPEEALLLRMKNKIIKSSLEVDLAQLRNKIMKSTFEADIAQLRNRIEKSLVEVDLARFKNEIMKGVLEKDLSRLENAINYNTIEADLAQLKNKIKNSVLDLTRMKHKMIDRNLTAELNKFQTRMGNLLQIVQAENSAFNDADNNSVVRKQQLQQLEHKLMSRIDKLQNPRNCSEARKLVCNVKTDCGMGCQSHHVLFCLITAYSTGRTLVLNDSNWMYSKGGWNSAFDPFSRNCTFNSTILHSEPWNSNNSATAQEVELPIIQHVSPSLSFLPMAVPSDFYAELTMLHGDPFIWFAGVLLKNVILKQNKRLLRYIDEKKSRIGFAKPIVGVHVRRTDKIGSEASFHDLSEYMHHVTAYYDWYELRHGVKLQRREKRVLLATDEAKLIAEAKQRYPKFSFSFDDSSARFADVKNRYSDNGLFGVISDAILLSETDYVVCTLSSQVCRLAEEIMQVGRDDSTYRVVSIDSEYYFYLAGQDVEVKALYSHSPISAGELELQVGDVISLGLSRAQLIPARLRNGFSHGRNKRTGKTGFFPSFKTELIIRKSDTPAAVS